VLAQFHAGSEALVGIIQRKEPLKSGRETEIDMIEREMEGGVLVDRPLDVHQHSVEDRPGGLVEVEEHVDVRDLPSKPPQTPEE